MFEYKIEDIFFMEIIYGTEKTTCIQSSFMQLINKKKEKN